MGMGAMIVRAHGNRLPHPLGHHCDALMRTLMLTMAIAVAVAMGMGCGISPRHRASLWTALPARVESEIPTHRSLRTSPPPTLLTDFPILSSQQTMSSLARHLNMNKHLVKPHLVTTFLIQVVYFVPSLPYPLIPHLLFTLFILPLFIPSLTGILRHAAHLLHLHNPLPGLPPPRAHARPARVEPVAQARMVAPLVHPQRSYGRGLRGDSRAS